MRNCELATAGWHSSALWPCVVCLFVVCRLTAARAWKEENGIAHKPAVFVTRGQFMRAMRSSGFDSKVRCVVAAACGGPL